MEKIEKEQLFKIVNKYFPRFKALDEINKIMEDWENDYLTSQMSIENLMVILLYRINRYVYKALLYDDITSNLAFKNYILKNYGCYISPKVVLHKSIILEGTNIIIDGNYIVRDNCIFENNILVLNKSLENIDNITYVIDKNTHISNNVMIINSSIGENVFIEDNCLIRENIESNSVVKIVNQLQITQKEKKLIPSQELLIYGIVPKYKNTLTIFGEGIYNPNVIIRIGGKKVSIAEIEYWDKNKIILKIKNDKNSIVKELEKLQKSTSLHNNFNVKIVVMSRGIKTTINDNKAIWKLLKNM